MGRKRRREKWLLRIDCRLKTAARLAGDRSLKNEGLVAGGLQTI